MAAENLQALVQGWAEDETGKQCFGEDFGVAVSWAPQPAQTPQGPVVVPGWFLLLTMRNPLLGQGHLYHMVPIGAPRPAEADVRKQVADGLRQLRDLSRSKLASQNGHGPKALASG